MLTVLITVPRYTSKQNLFKFVVMRGSIPSTVINNIIFKNIKLIIFIKN
jgi:hypothetical protein